MLKLNFQQYLFEKVFVTIYCHFLKLEASFLNKNIIIFSSINQSINLTRTKYLNGSRKMNYSKAHNKKPLIDWAKSLK